MVSESDIDETIKSVNLGPKKIEIVGVVGSNPKIFAENVAKVLNERKQPFAKVHYVIHPWNPNDSFYFYAYIHFIKD